MWYAIYPIIGICRKRTNNYFCTDCFRLILIKNNKASITKGLKREK